MVYVLIAVTLNCIPAGSMGLCRDTAPSVYMQEFNSLKSCQVAASAIRKELDQVRNQTLKLICTEKG